MKREVHFMKIFLKNDFKTASKQNIISSKYQIFTWKLVLNFKISQTGGGGGPPPPPHPEPPGMGFPFFISSPPNPKVWLMKLFNFYD